MRISLSIAMLCVMVLTPRLSIAAPGSTIDFEELGWIERVEIQPEGFSIVAKLDTGADHSSLHAKDIAIYDVNGEERVKFIVRNRKGEEHQFDLPVRRVAQIKRVRGITQERPVVQMQICIGHVSMKVDVNLTDRSNFSYPMLIGRGWLAGNAKINPGRAYSVEPSCNE